MPPLPGSPLRLAKSRSEMYAAPLPPSPAAAAAAAAAAERVHSLRAAAVSAGHFAPSVPGSSHAEGGERP